MTKDDLEKLERIRNCLVTALRKIEIEAPLTQGGKDMLWCILELDDLLRLKPRRPET